MRVVTWLPGHGWRDGHWDSGAVPKVELLSSLTMTAGDGKITPDP